MTVHVELTSSAATQLPPSILVPSRSENWTVHQSVSSARSWLFVAVRHHHHHHLQCFSSLYLITLDEQCFLGAEEMFFSGKDVSAAPPCASTLPALEKWPLRLRHGVRPSLTATFTTNIISIDLTWNSLICRQLRALYDIFSEESHDVKQR